MEKGFKPKQYLVIKTKTGFEDFGASGIVLSETEFFEGMILSEVNPSVTLTKLKGPIVWDRFGCEHEVSSLLSGGYIEEIP